MELSGFGLECAQLELKQQIESAAMARVFDAHLIEKIPKNALSACLVTWFRPITSRETDDQRMIDAMQRVLGDAKKDVEAILMRDMRTISNKSEEAKRQIVSDLVRERITGRLNANRTAERWGVSRRTFYRIKEEGLSILDRYVVQSVIFFHSFVRNQAVRCG